MLMTGKNKNSGIVINSEAPEALEASFNFIQEHQDRLKMFLFGEFHGDKAWIGVNKSERQFCREAKKKYMYVPLNKRVVEP